MLTFQRGVSVGFGTRFVFRKGDTGHVGADQVRGFENHVDSGQTCVFPKRDGL